jgi:NADH dehydrogenase
MQSSECREPSCHELDYLAQVLWHGFRFRFGETVGLDRAQRLVHLTANFDAGRLITPVRAFGYDTLVIAIGSVTNDFGTPDIKERGVALDTTKKQTPCRGVNPRGSLCVEYAAIRGR